MKRDYNDPLLKKRRRSLRRDQTDAEKLLWARLRHKGFFSYKFIRQYGIGPYIVDFYCPEKRLAIELDGGQHNEAEKTVYDTERSECLNAMDVNVVRFWNNDVLSNMEGVLERLVELVTPPHLPLP